MDIDNPHFDPTKGFFELVGTHSLEELLTIENNLTNEIKALDSNMQTLVYENYNKFISATDTIRSMKRNVESMDAELNSLTEAMANIETITDRVQSKLQPSQAEIRRLDNIERELKKIKFICDLPSQLRASIERNRGKELLDFEQVVSSYAECAEFLMKHKEESAYVAIYKETKEGISGVTKLLWLKLAELSLPESLFMKYVRQIAKLGGISEKLALQLFAL
jgi:DNA repair ATPase RecN